MKRRKAIEQSTLTLQEFWSWLAKHPNCILRAGSLDVVVYDNEELYWHIGEWQEVLSVEVIRGKQLAADLFIRRDMIDYIRVLPGEQEEEYEFHLVQELEGQPILHFIFVMAHGFEGREGTAFRRVH